jgi:hypothetical protein
VAVLEDCSSNGTFINGKKIGKGESGEAGPGRAQWIWRPGWPRGRTIASVGGRQGCGVGTPLNRSHETPAGSPSPTPGRRVLRRPQSRFPRATRSAWSRRSPPWWSRCGGVGRRPRAVPRRARAARPPAGARALLCGAPEHP